MKQIVVNIQDSAYDCLVGMLNLCQQVEVVSTEELQGALSDVDECFAKAIKVLQDERVIRNQYDYAFIYMAIQEGVISGMEPFYSVPSFTAYLKDLKIANPPCNSSIKFICKQTQGDFPEWMYIESHDPNEERRRRNIVFRFSSAFSRLLRGSV